MTLETGDRPLYGLASGIFADDHEKFLEVLRREQNGKIFGGFALRARRKKFWRLRAESRTKKNWRLCAESRAEKILEALR
jgi:hypothetical protein